ncbi:MAG: hemerythrin domain-containing protein [Steroidobacteraceae bacterium]
MSKPKATKKPDTKSAVDAIELLKADHRRVENLFADFEAAEVDSRDAIAQSICQELTIHAQIEEEILYPEAKVVLEEDDEDLVNEAQIEHASAKDLIAQIESMTTDDEMFNATVKVLSEYIKHHVKEEEEELFPMLEESDLDLEEMGGELAARREELLAEMAEADPDAEDEDEDEDEEDDEDDLEEDDDAEDDEELEEDEEEEEEKPAKKRAARTDTGRM